MANQTLVVPVGKIKDCRLSTGGEEYIVTFHVIKMHSNSDTFPILLGRPWLRMANAIVDWGGLKPSITYGPQDNRVKVSIGSLGGKVTEDPELSSGKEEEKNEAKCDDTLVGVVQSNERKNRLDVGSGSLDPSFYSRSDDGEFAQWLRDYPESGCDAMMISHHKISKKEDVTEVGLVQVDGTQEEENAVQPAKLEEPLHFKTTSTGILVGQDVREYPQVPPDWYRSSEEQTHVAEKDWKYVELKGVPREMVEHRISLVPGAKPIRQKERRMNPQLQLLVRAELERLLKAGFIKPVEITDWVSPMVLVKKKNGKIRVCVDYRKLNACTQKDHFPLPFITLLLEEVGGHARYTFMDGYAGYNQISIAVQDVHKTAFTTPWGTFVWVVMPFGLCNAPATFQRLVMYIFTDLLYKSMTALIRCRRMQLALNPEKTFLGVQRGVLLGYVVSEKGRELDPDKIAVIEGLATPTNAKGVAKLLGHVGWYRELIPDFAKIVVPITQLLRKENRFEWTDACQEAFEELKSRLSTYPVLRPPDWSMPFHVFCDASSVAVGSALYEKRKDLPIAYASRQLNPAERNYSTTERECLAMVFSVKKFRHYLICNPVVFFVDHMAIKYLVNKAELSGKLARWVLLLEEFDYTVEYKPGCMHLQADHLSRLSEDVETSPLDDRLIDDSLFVVTAQPEWYAGIVEFLTTQQLSGDWTKEERRKVRVNSRHFAVIGHRLFRRGADGVLRRCVSEVEVPAILEACHDSACAGHFSGQLTGQKILRAGYFWPRLFRDSHEYVKRYDACQRYARNDLRMEMPTCMAYIIVATEYLTKWAEAKAVKTNTAAHAATFMYKNIISRFGCPKILVSDRGRHFLNEMFQELTDRFEIDHRKTTPYHPQTNGQIERVNGTLVSILRKTVVDSKRDWDTKLTAALWAYRTTFKVTTQATPFSLVYGLEATLPIEFEVESLRVAVQSRLTNSQSLRNRLTTLEELDERRRMSAQHIEAIQRRRKITFDKKHKKRTLRPGMMVMLQDGRKLEFPGKFDEVWLGPYLIREVFPNNLVQLETLNGEVFPTCTAGSRCKQYRI
ncbi:hypothetical protein MARPO_0207s0002 [Marchantia polymorpha]|uniref:Integrase catalytic domain-containing protein n=1 Tax=Marchantia polymorpha TaxID=3197 RepID=A0A2R6W0C1_MARPO|nr:hypothetical protein MARPO_0207s0002 [Marchantia polymorpha]|eukprot:PTQ27291.1 hypothetical protein MARPO_0207s0002 [Marchantia polymorpha]